MFDVVGAILGGIFYDGLKKVGQPLFTYIKNQLKTDLPKLAIDDDQIIQIAERVKALGLSETEDKSEYLQRISQDKQLQQLLKISINDNSINQIANHSPNATLVAGDNIGGDSIGGDKITGDKFTGDKVAGDKVAGDKIKNIHHHGSKKPKK